MLIEKSVRHFSGRIGKISPDRDNPFKRPGQKSFVRCPCPLPEPDLHRLDRASFAWRTRIVLMHEIGGSPVSCISSANRRARQIGSVSVFQADIIRLVGGGINWALAAQHRDNRRLQLWMNWMCRSSTEATGWPTSLITSRSLSPASCTRSRVFTPVWTGSAVLPLA